MDMMSLRRGLMGQMAGSNITIIETTLTIPENSVNRTRGVREFIQAQYPDADILLEFSLIDTPTSNNQFTKYLYDTSNFDFVTERWNGSESASVNWDKTTYSAYLVQGTQYKVKYLKNIYN